MKGDRIELDHTSDPYTKLKPGDRGTDLGHPDALGTLNIKWDSGSTLGLNREFGDRWHVVEKESAGEGVE